MNYKFLKIILHFEVELKVEVIFKKWKLFQNVT